MAPKGPTGLVRLFRQMLGTQRIGPIPLSWFQMEPQLLLQLGPEDSRKVPGDRIVVMLGRGFQRFDLQD